MDSDGPTAEPEDAPSIGILPSTCSLDLAATGVDIETGLQPSSASPAPDKDADAYPTCMAVMHFAWPGNVGPGGQPIVCEYHIVGTAHVSTQSCEDVRKVIQRVKPDVVMLELCNARSGLLQPAAKVVVQSFSEMINDVKSGKQTLLGAVYSWMLGRMGEHMEVLPGEEFRVALQEARAIGAKINLGDRNVQITLLRTWAALSLWEKIKFIWYLLYTGVAIPDADEMRELLEELKETDMTTQAIKEMGKEFPNILEPLIYERDRYMVYMLKRLARQATKVVAVVGAGHLPGIRENWEKDIDIAEIVKVPTKPQHQARWISWPSLAIVIGVGTTALIYLRR